MKRIALIILVLLFGLSQVAFASSEKNRQLAEELLHINNVKSQLDKMYVQMQQMVRQQIESIEMANQEQNHVEKIEKIATDILFDGLSWPAIKDEYIELYASTFSEQELAEIIAFSKSPLGRKLAEKTPILMQKSMEIGQQRAQRVFPEIQAAIQEYIEQHELQ